MTILGGIPAPPIPAGIAVSTATFGAVVDVGAPNGVDDTAAIAAAIAAGGPGAWLLFRSGTYLADGLVPDDDQFWSGSPAGTTIKARTSSTGAWILGSSAAVSGVTVCGITLDANATNRTVTAGTGGVLFTDASNVLLVRVTATGGLGTSGGTTTPSIAFHGTGSGNYCIECNTHDNGITGRPCDGIYFGTQSNSFIYLCRSVNNTDTSFVLEGCNQSQIVGGASISTPSGFGVGALGSASCYGNQVLGLTIYGWNSSTNGACQIYTISTGSLVDTTVSNLTVVSSSSTGPAMNIRATSTGIVNGLALSTIVIDGASTQGILLGPCKNVTLDGYQISGTGAGCVQVQSTASNVSIGTGILTPGASVAAALSINGGTNVYASGVQFVGNGTNTGWGVYIYSGANIRISSSCTFSGFTSGTVGPAPVVAAAAGAGTSPPAPTDVGATDVRGAVSMGTGTSPAAGNQATVTFASAYLVTPEVVVSATNAATAALGPYVASRSGTGFTIGFANAPAASQAPGTYLVSYQVIE